MPALQRPVLLRDGTSDIHTFRQVFVEGQYDFSLGFEPRIIVDAGANIGCASLLFANTFPSATIIALEPELTNFEMLALNTRGERNIFPVRAALWGWPTRVRLRDPAHEKWAVEFEEGAGAEIPAVTIPDVMAAFGLDRIDLLKVDVEGAEREIFTTADAWLDRVRAIAIELHDEFTPGCGDSFRSVVLPRAGHRFTTGETLVCILEARAQ